MKIIYPYSENEKIRIAVWRHVFAEKKAGITISELVVKTGFERNKIYRNLKSLTKSKILQLVKEKSVRSLKVFVHPEFLRRTS